MNSYDLAWRGTTVEEKRELLAKSLKTRDRKIAEGKYKDGRLGLASSCVDIINTAKASISKDPHSAKEWSQLMAEAARYGIESVTIALKEGTETWHPSDFEVAGVILLQKGERPDIDQSLILFNDGREKALESGDVGEELLLLGQLIRGYMALKDMADVESAIEMLTEALKKGRQADPKILTRVFRALAEGAKFMAIEYAQAAKSKNQELKARSI